jgi:hypothetical protein
LGDLAIAQQTLPAETFRGTADLLIRLRTVQMLFAAICDHILPAGSAALSGYDVRRTVLGVHVIAFAW